MTGPTVPSPGLPTAADLVVAGRLRLPDRSWADGELWVRDGRVAAVVAGRHPDAVTAAGARLLDVGEDLVLPGAVDAHVHSLSHVGEGIAAATASAAGGGVTTIVEMPFDAPGPIWTADRVRVKRDLVAREAVVDTALLGTLHPDRGWTAAPAMAEAGVVGFKVSTYLTDPDRFPRMSDLALLDVLAAGRDVGRTICVHTENDEIVRGLSAAERAAGHEDAASHARTRPPVAEHLAVLTVLEIAAERGGAVHMCHASSPRTGALVRWYREQGVDATVETCPHYLTFTDADVDRLAGRLKINPPLRPAALKEGLWEGLAAGDVHLITSDHAPWPAALKDRPRMLDNASGVPGVQTIVPLVLGQAAGRGLLDAALDALTLAPAARYGFADRKGSLEVGKDADVMVVRLGDDPIEESTQLSNAGWTPYAGLRPGASVRRTIVRGTTVWTADDGLLARPGDGELVTAVG